MLFRGSRVKNCARVLSRLQRAYGDSGPAPNYLDIIRREYGDDFCNDVIDYYNEHLNPNLKE